MTAWQRLKSAAGWGLFLGFCDWVLAFAITNKITSGGVRAIILAQTLLGAIIGLVRWKAAWWVKGLLFGLGVNIPLAFGLSWLGPEWGRQLFVPILAAGILIGLFIEWVMRKKT